MEKGCARTHLQSGRCIPLVTCIKGKASSTPALGFWPRMHWRKNTNQSNTSRIFVTSKALEKRSPYSCSCLAVCEHTMCDWLFCTNLWAIRSGENGTLSKKDHLVNTTLNPIAAIHQHSPTHGWTFTIKADWWKYHDDRWSMDKKVVNYVRQH